MIVKGMLAHSRKNNGDKESTALKSHGGSIEVKTETAGGTRFIITLPFD